MAKIVFDPSIHAFCLSICAGVEGCTDILLDSCRFAHCFGKVTGKSGVSIGYDALGDSEPREEVSKVELRYSLTIYGLIAG